MELLSTQIRLRRLFSDVKQKATELVNGANPSCAKDRDEDTLVQLLGSDNPGR